MSKYGRLAAISGVLALTGLTAWSIPGEAAGVAKLRVTLTGIADKKPIPGQNAFCVAAPQGHVASGGNKSPKISWAPGPKETKSYAIISYDEDVPVDVTNINRDDKTIPANAKRHSFYHWVLVDIHNSTVSLDEGADSSAVIAKGKAPGPTRQGTRGVNDFTSAFANDPQMKGLYGGYDGPCPPWNDMKLHRYHFLVYALDIPSLKLKANFDGAAAIKAMAGHVLAKGETVGVYSLNPTVNRMNAIK